MDFLTLAKQRCSVRRFKKTEVEEEKLEKLLEAAHVAPTAANQQSQRLLVSAKYSCGFSNLLDSSIIVNER